MKNFALLCILWGTLCVVSDPAVAQPVDIGSRLEVFIDTYLIDTLTGTRLMLHHPVPRETVLKFDAPWEGIHCGYVTIILDNGRYRLYYRGMPARTVDGTAGECTCYAESADGIHFIKPKLGLFERNGTRENNVILSGLEPLSHNFAPFLDENPGAKPDERYKAFAGTAESGGLIPFASPDGIHWRKLRDKPVITQGAFDSQNIAFWSSWEKCYLSYFRFFTPDGFRSIKRATSTDFINWTEPVEMTYGDTPREHLYTNQTRPYFRAPHLYIATAARFMQGRRILTDEQAIALGADAAAARDCSDTVLMTSRGGDRYDRTFMEGFVRPGLGISNWTTRTNYPAHGVVPTGDGEMSMYVQRDYGQPTHSLQRLAMRTDGFASVNAPYAGGEMRAKPFQFTGGKLHINYATSAAGGIKIEIQDESGAAIPGYAAADADEIIGDEIDRVVTWHGKPNLAPISGKPVRLRVIMKDADFYSIKFSD